MKINIDKGAQYIVKTLNKNNFKAYIVGGSVRDGLMGLPINDFDIATDARPEKVMSLFEKTIPTGLKHGTVTVILNNLPYEVTTFRTENEYIDNRHPTSVNFVENLEEDLKRRDFTINAMAYDCENDEIIDLFQSKSDLNKRIIKAVGDADTRFNEDALRILRGIRFASCFNFNIEPQTMVSMAKNSHLLKNISEERIFAELKKILLCDKPSHGINLLLYTGCLNVILPELIPMAGFNQFSKYHDKDVYYHTMAVLDNVKKDIVLRLTALFHDSGKPFAYSMDEKGNGHFYGHEDISSEIAKKALDRLKVDNKTKERVIHLISKHMVSLEMKKKVKIKKLINDLGQENIDNFFDFKLADYGGKPEDVKMDDNFYRLRDSMKKIIDDKEPLSLKDLAISGNDLLNMGIGGLAVGDTLKVLLQEVLSDPSLNNKEQLIKLAKEINKDAK